MSRFIVWLGSFPELAQAELAALVGAQPTALSSHLVAVESKHSAADLMVRLGGSVKIVEPVVVLPLTTSTDELLSQLVMMLPDQPKLEYALTIEHLQNSHQAIEVLEHIDATQLKRALTAQGKKVRYHESEAFGLPAAVLLHRAVTELVILVGSNELQLCRTLAVQDIDTWSKHDRGKPFAQHQRGMLPPKLARMMVNIALAQREPATELLVDPFVGAGTVLLEAALLGIPAQGADLDPEAVAGTQANLDWFNELTAHKTPLSVSQADAVHWTLDKPASLLVTEPFLGKPSSVPHKVANVAKGLEKMYLGFFKHFISQLQEHSRVVVVFPRFVTPKHAVSLYAKLIDRLEALGYTPCFAPLSYARPGARVEREIGVFELKK